MIKFISDLQQVGRLFSSGTPVSSTKETDSYDITAILLKVTLKHPNRSHVFEKNLCADIHLIAYFIFFFITQRNPLSRTKSTPVPRGQSLEEFDQNDNG